MKKLLAGFGLAAAGILGLGGPATASSYPPGSIGTLSIETPVCNYTSADHTELASWSVTINYTATVDDAWLLVVNPIVDDIIGSHEVPMGSGSMTITNETPGVGGSTPLYGNIDVTLGSKSSEQIIEASSPGCPIASVDNKTPPTKINPPKPNSNNKKPTSVLPETGLDATEMAVLAAALTATGITLVWATRRRDTLTS